MDDELDDLGIWMKEVRDYESRARRWNADRAREEQMRLRRILFACSFSGGLIGGVVGSILWALVFA